MTNSIKTLIIVLSTVVLTSCYEFREVNTSNVKLGMTKKEVQDALRKKPGVVIAAKKLPETNTIIEVVRYSSGDYWFYFINDRLEKWEPSDIHHPPYIDDMVPNKSSLK